MGRGEVHGGWSLHAGGMNAVADTQQGCRTLSQVLPFVRERHNECTTRTEVGKGGRDGGGDGTVGCLLPAQLNDGSCLPSTLGPIPRECKVESATAPKLEWIG